MEDILKRKDNESDFEYGLRLIKLKMEDDKSDIDWQDIVELTNANIHRDSLRKSCQTKYGGYNVMKYYEEKIEGLLITKYGGYNVMKYYEEKIEGLLINKENNKIENTVEEDEYIEKLKKAKEDLYKEKVKLQDERRQYNAFVRNEARWEEIKETIENEAKALNTTKPLLSESNYLKNGEQIATLLISDIHLGIEVDSYLNTYNTDIAKQYMKTLELKVIQYCKIHNVKELNLEILGDLISGIIHITTRLYQQEDVINQTMICAEMLSELIHNLSKQIEKINIYFSVGNHSRIMASYKEHLSEENFEYIILWHLKTRLKTVDNVEFKENIYDNEMIVYEVFGKKIVSVHGHKDKPESAIMSLSKMLGVLFDEAHMGHFHNFSFKNKTLINGAFCGVDQYAQDKRFNTLPSQVMKIYYENSDECIYEINLK